MGRKKSRILTDRKGRKYRVTPLDERHDRAAKAWDLAHLHTLSTRVPGEMWAAYNALLKKERTTAYADLQKHVRERLNLTKYGRF